MKEDKLLTLRELREKYVNYPFDETFSWVDKGFVTYAKNQDINSNDCGASTAFAVTGAVESCFAKVRLYIFL